MGNNERKFGILVIFVIGAGFGFLLAQLIF